MSSRSDHSGLALQKPFVQSMRILFSILEDGSGLVKFTEIEKRWGKDSQISPGLLLPTGRILECLRNVTTASGDLTFDRFCAGLKICLLKNSASETTNGGGDHDQHVPLPPPKPPRLNPGARLTDSTVSSQDTASPPRRREPRRHTLQNGIDYNRLKRLKQLEQEKTLLKETLLAVNETQSWLNQTLHAVHDQIRYVARSSEPLDMFTGAPNHQERLDLKRAQMGEVKRSLLRLANNWSSIERNDFPFELNLETQWRTGQEKMRRLKQDNHRLFDELNRKQETISRLEIEKAHLMRQIKRC